jgi:beta-phosphoglucomutase-like phosphatase (HAD superfamily)
MGVAPQRCLVVEDSPAGAAAARAAGMPAFGFVGASHAAPADLAARLDGAVDALFDDMARLPELVRKLEMRGARTSL